MNNLNISSDKVLWRPSQAGLQRAPVVAEGLQNDLESEFRVWRGKIKLLGGS